METARCPFCWTCRPLKKDGTFRHHYGYAKWCIDRRPCEGIGKRPDGTDPKTDLKRTLDALVKQRMLITPNRRRNAYYRRNHSSTHHRQ